MNKTDLRQRPLKNTSTANKSVTALSPDPHPPTTAPQEPVPLVQPTALSRSTVWGLALLGAILVWLVQPPLAVAPLAWVALVPWSVLAILNGRPGKGGYTAIWCAGSLYWLMTMQGVRLAHPALYPGWFVLAAYLGIYPMFFVGLSRVAVHAWRWPLVIAVPMIWSGLELIRSYAFTGFSAALLAHSQVDSTWVIQVADLGGSYIVSFVIAMISACVVQVVHGWRYSAWRSVWCTLLGTAAILGATLAYGNWRTHEDATYQAAGPLFTALVVQRDEPLIFSLDAGREREVFENYVDSTLTALAAHPNADLVIWPESMFTGGMPYRILDEPVIVPPKYEITEAEFRLGIAEWQTEFDARNQWFQGMLASVTKAEPPMLLMGASVVRYAERPHVYGAAIQIDSNAQVVDWYGKRHLVMFGEYIPFGSWMPWLYEIGPLTQGATPGPEPKAMQVAGTAVAPNICFETMVEHVTGNGLRQLRQQGSDPQVIVNVTNDAWFHGSSILSHHLRCSRMVAVANRTPLMMAANQGPTAWIDGSGQIVKSLPYQTNDSLIVEPWADPRTSLYAKWGDKLSWPLGAVCFVAMGSGYRRFRKQKS